MHKENLLRLQTRGQVYGLFKSIEGCSGDTFGWVPETMFQPFLKYPRMDDQKIGLLNLITMLREGLKAATNPQD